MVYKFYELGLGDFVFELLFEGDLVINGVLFEFLVDIFSEVGALLTWRAIRWNMLLIDLVLLLEEEE